MISGTRRFAQSSIRLSLDQAVLVAGMRAGAARNVDLAHEMNCARSDGVACDQAFLSSWSLVRWPPSPARRRAAATLSRSGAVDNRRCLSCLPSRSGGLTDNRRHGRHCARGCQRFTTAPRHIPRPNRVGPSTQTCTVQCVGCSARVWRPAASASGAMGGRLNTTGRHRNSVFDLLHFVLITAIIKIRCARPINRRSIREVCGDPQKR